MKSVRTPLSSIFSPVSSACGRVRTLGLSELMAASTGRKERLIFCSACGVASWVSRSRPHEALFHACNGDNSTPLVVPVESQELPVLPMKYNESWIESLWPTSLVAEEDVDVFATKEKE